MGQPKLKYALNDFFNTYFKLRRAIKNDCLSAKGNEVDSILKWAHKAGEVFVQCKN